MKMKKKFSIWIFVLVALVFFSIRLQAATYTVDDNGPADFSTIQAAINFAGPNDVVYVFPGVYYEQVTMKDRVNLFGSGPHVTTIDGRGMFDQVVQYSGLHGAIISGFKITGSSNTAWWTTSGLCCWEGPLIIRNNIIEGNFGGICVHEARAKPTIVNNTIVDNFNGIVLGVRTDVPLQVDVAYIYKKDTSSAKSYASFLKENRFSVDLIPLEEVAGIDFTKYGVIAVGSDTSFGFEWGTPAAVAAITRSGRPVLGLGFGGAGFFQEAGLSINWGHGWIGEENSIYVVDPKHVVFNSPNRISLPPNRVIQLYEATQHIGEYAPDLSSRAVLLGREPKNLDHYPLVQEGEHLLWGFTASPANMTKVGRSLFLNIVCYLHPLWPRPPKTHTIMNNIIARNAQVGIFYYMYAAYDSEILYNDVWGNPYRNYHDNHTGTTFVPQPGTGEISADPRFADAVYRLAEGSPCIDTGHPGPQYNDPDGTRNDMGAYGGPEASGRTGFAGSGFIILNIGNIPSVEINQDKDHPCHGLADVNATEASQLGIPQYKDCPFGGNLWIRGIFGNVDPITHYQILVGKWEGSSEPTVDECTPLSDSLTKVKYYIDDANGAVTYKYLSLGPKTIGGVDNLYELTSGEMKPEWVGGKLYWTCWTQADLRMQWYTPPWENDKYIIRYKAYNYHPVFGLTELTLGSNDLDHLTLIVDNNPVDANIHSVKYNTGEVIPECGIIRLADANENLIFTITASHPTGYLRDYWLSALYGKNKSLGYVVQDHYTGLNEGGPPLWHGVTETPFNSADAPPGQLLPWETCAYQFRLYVQARTTDGQNQVIYWKEFNDHYYIDVGGCAWCGGADINHSGKVDWFDFSIFASHWLDSCGPTCE